MGGLFTPICTSRIDCRSANLSKYCWLCSRYTQIGRTLAFGVDIRYAIGASLVSVIATSSGAASAYVKEGYTNLRLGMFLEVATTGGAIVGAIVAGMVSTRAIAIVFGIVLLYSSYLSRQHRLEHLESEPPDPLATSLKLNGSYPTPDGQKFYWQFLEKDSS
jgi:uncharacterized protein